jgi:hypothetical protein
MAGDDIVDAEWEEVPDHDGNLHVAKPADRPTEQARYSTNPTSPPPPRREAAYGLADVGLFFRGLWRVVVVVLGVLALLVVLMILVPAPEISSSPGDDKDNTASAPATQGEQPAAAPADGGAKQMLSDWSQKVTGKASSTGVVMVNGPGKRGEFCQNTKGDTLLRFGGMRASDTNEMLFDYFVEMHTGPGTELVGSFWYDPVDQRLQLNDLVEATKERSSVPDQQRAFEVVDQGVVTIGGTRYHVCVL